MQEKKMLIDGAFVYASDRAILESKSPIDGKCLGTFPSAAAGDIKKAVDAASSAQKEWSQKSFNQRAAFLLKAADILAGAEEEIVTSQCLESGKPLQQCKGEYTGVPDVFRSCVAAAMHNYGNVYPNNGDSGEISDITMTLTEPLGVVCCMGPFNFPISNLSYKVAAALIMGNTVIVKAASDVALTTILYVEKLQQAGFPAGVVQVVTGPGNKIVKWIMDSNKVNAVAFTGSTEVGCELIRNSAENMQRVLLELGGNDALIICEDADLDYAVSEAMSRLLISGQNCCVPKRFLVQKAIKDEFLGKLLNAVKNIKVGDPMDTHNDMGPLISERAAVEVEKQIQHTVAQGAKLICGGQREGAYVYPTILDNVTRNMDIARDMEIFGPVFPIITFEDDAEAIEICNLSCYGLNGGVITSDFNRSIRLASKMQSGTIVTNGGGRWRRDTAPFGGYKKSGLGREGITDILHELSQRKTLVIKNLNR